MNRVSLKITGAQGQGVNSVGEVVGKGLKRGGYCVFGYREYMSLIKGGHSSYQLDVSDAYVESTETKVNVLVCFNHHGLESNLREVKTGGVVIHQSDDWKFSAEDTAWLKQENITVLLLPVEKLLRENKYPAILGNMLITSVVWCVLGQNAEALKALAAEQFARKGEKVIGMNHRCIDLGGAFVQEKASGVNVALPDAKAEWKDCLFLTGSQAMGMGVIHAGCRLFAGYTMTPASPLLTFIAENQNRSGMVIKQAEDEITAAQIVSGAMHMGTRALTGTSGGGFDLMTETLSLNGIIENPSVFVLAQRPGPATGLPTWTGQGDLLLAVHSGHGEYPRCVMSVSGSEDAFHLMPEAFNLAERYQISVIVLTDKQIAEGIYTQKPYDQSRTVIDRGAQLITDPAKLKTLKGTDRYDATAKDGVSPRWLPGCEADTYCAQGDEHNGDGSVDETAHNAVAQMDKRMRKLQALKNTLPEPELYTASSKFLEPSSKDEMLDVLIVGWGSTKGPMLDVLREAQTKNTTLNVGYLHFTYLWPLKFDRYVRLLKTAKRTVLLEGNFQGQLGMLLMQECGVRPAENVLKYDGRPFFADELHSLLKL